jgi:hypothetical protein
MYRAGLYSGQCCLVFKWVIPPARTSDFGLRTSDFGLRTSDFGLRTSDFGLRTFLAYMLKCQCVLCRQCIKEFYRNINLQQMLV